MCITGVFHCQSRHCNTLLLWMLLGPIGVVPVIQRPISSFEKTHQGLHYLSVTGVMQHGPGNTMLCCSSPAAHTQLCFAPQPQRKYPNFQKCSSMWLVHVTALGQSAPSDDESDGFRYRSFLSLVVAEWSCSKGAKVCATAEKGGKINPLLFSAWAKLRFILRSSNYGAPLPLLLKTTEDWHLPPQPLPVHI